MGRNNNRRKLNDPVYTPPTTVRKEAMDALFEAGGVLRRSTRFLPDISETENNIPHNSIDVQANNRESGEDDDDEIGHDGSGAGGEGVDEAGDDGADGNESDFKLAVSLIFAMVNGDGNEFDYLTSVGLIHELINGATGEGGGNGIDFLGTLSLINTLLYGAAGDSEGAVAVLVHHLAGVILN